MSLDTKIEVSKQREHQTKRMKGLRTVFLVSGLIGGAIFLVVVLGLTSMQPVREPGPAFSEPREAVFETPSPGPVRPAASSRLGGDKWETKADKDTIDDWKK